MKVNSLDDRLGVAIASSFVLALSFAFACWAWRTNSPETLSRGGATILVFAALSVVWQVTRERSSEMRVENHEETARAEIARQTSTTPSVIHRIALKSRAAATTELLNVRRIYIWFVAVTTVYGEFLHGWGDLIMKGLGVKGTG